MVAHPMGGGWGTLRALRREDEVSAHRMRPGTARRVLAFAAPYRREISVFLATVVVAAALGVATPVIAGRVVDTITGGGPGAEIGRAHV